MKKMIVFDAAKCTGCKTCEIVCSFKNDQVFGSSRARIRNFRDLDQSFFVSLTCMQCEDPPCVKICPTMALSKENGLVRMEPLRCIGCKICMLACPFGAIAFDQERGFAIKCELCGGDPECVAFCPTGALQYREIDTANVDKQGNLFAKLKEVCLSS
jgi:Fe-S-cluster-containing dehydrogenase component